ncbi:hypothetical protein H744_2c2138 [Photobacterium gaetbulicola Gung47]|uniref:Uncharacterized protein n=1 Tax=Photobacterium gaetbulicola Gung47 TaxID=658445 RepID=A0A0C5WR60_9GAMM|nr:hypothetical protein H744_2c2138 [Photobacterium gaetbulicola Gung47]
MTQEFTDIDSEELDGLIQRVQEAKEHDLALSPEDCQILLKALKTLAALQERLSDNDITLHKLRKLVGMVRSSETMDTLLGQKGKGSQKRPRPRATKPNTQVKPKITQHKLDDLSKGDRCPECQQVNCTNMSLPPCCGLPDKVHSSRNNTSWSGCAVMPAANILLPSSPMRWLRMVNRAKSMATVPVA